MDRMSRMGRMDRPAVVEWTVDQLDDTVALCAQALDLPEDAAEAGPILRTLTAAREDRHMVRVATADGSGVALGSTGPGPGPGDAGAGYIDLVAVHPAARRRGLGRALVTAVEQRLAERGVTGVHLAGHPPGFAWPGVDVRYTPAMCAAEALGYAHTRTAWNMTADLAAVPDPAPGEARLAAAGVAVRRAGAADVPALAAFADAEFGGAWAAELADAVRYGGVHLAERNGQVTGFAAYGGCRPSWFGPMGTAPAGQGLGIGTVLLRRCLLDQRSAGLATAQVCWVGPVRFYAGAVGARVERVFFLFHKALSFHKGPGPGAAQPTTEST
ncbi:MAG TPA: GNAT family N-acetyltransferase [Kribbellaceae bacterium]|nr:GNAT family N-acetyltransferase [Kribbellaceae bacterium]